jgi:hypothetical protein
MTGFGLCRVFIPDRFREAGRAANGKVSGHEDGTDRGFRNVGYQYSDAGKTPKRKHITYKTRRKLNTLGTGHLNC